MAKETELVVLEANGNGAPPVADAPIEEAPHRIVHVEFDDGFPPLNIDVDALDWGAMEVMATPAEASFAELAGVMKQLCPDGGYKKLHVLRDSARFFEAVGKAIQAAGNPTS